MKLASEEMKTRGSTTSSEPSSSLLTSSNKGEVPMKRSLERFLQKRKHRK
ncbi:putative transcription regulator Others family [Helianthus annuus]|nr:putative transcription regulator Others family [Helianthus annuus]